MTRLRNVLTSAATWALAASSLVGTPALGKVPFPAKLAPESVAQLQHEAQRQRAAAKATVYRNARLLGYTPSQIQQALKPALDLRGSFQLALKDGTVVEFPWYRIGFAENSISNTGKAIKHNDQGRVLRHETNKGGIRLHRGVFADEVYALALKMDTKLSVSRDALDGQAFRGAKGGIGAGRIVKVGTTYEAQVGDYVDPADGVFDRAAIMRSFALGYRASGGQVGPGFDIQAGDVNTKAPEMRVLAETYGSPELPSAGVSGKAVITRADGTIDPRGGIAYRGVATGDGVWMSARLAARRAGLTLYGATVLSQGYGEVGRAFAMSAKKDGAKVIGVQELWNVDGKTQVGTLLLPQGAQAKPKQVQKWLDDVDQVLGQHLDLRTYKSGSLLASFKPGVDVSVVPADIVGLNALGEVLTQETVPAYVQSGTHHGRRKILVEGANLAETQEGAKLLDVHHDTLLTVAGDLANLGGVHVSNMEAAQNLYRSPVTSEKAKRALLGTMRSGWQRATTIGQRLGVSERRAIELASVDGMMKRSLHLPGAPLANIEEHALSAQ